MCFANSAGSSIGIKWPLRGMTSNRALGIRATTSRGLPDVLYQWTVSVAQLLMGLAKTVPNGRLVFWQSQPE
jgi:hypothetical protein